MSLSRQRVFLFLVALAIQSHLFVADISAEDLLAEVRAGNKAALDSIRTLSCRMTVANPVSVVPQSQMAPVEHWQSGDSIRVRFADAFQLTDAVRHHGVNRTSFVSQEGNVFSIRPVQSEQRMSRFDPHRSGLLALFGPKGSPLPLEKILSQPHKIKGVSRQPLDGHDCVLVKMSFTFDGGSKGDFEIWFDPQVNYLARRLTGDFSGSPDMPPSRRESQVLKFVEAAPGIHFPAEAETKFLTGKKMTEHQVVTFTDIRINQPLPADIFELPIPPNATVLDAVADREYKVDANGKETGTSRPLAKGMPGMPGKPGIPGKSGQPTASAPSPAPVSQRATTKEPEPMTRWVLYGLWAVLAIAGGIWYVRRLRTAAT
jgi:hypothetical protein